MSDGAPPLITVEEALPEQLGFDPKAPWLGRRSREALLEAVDKGWVEMRLLLKGKMPGTILFYDFLLMAIQIWIPHQYKVDNEYPVPESVLQEWSQDLPGNVLEALKRATLMDLKPDFDGDAFLNADGFTTCGIVTFGDVVRDPMAFRPASEFRNPQSFPTYKAIQQFLRKNPGIRCRKPSKQRLMIHVGDWLAHTQQLPRNPLDYPAQVVDEILEIEHRKAEERMRRAQS